MRVVSLFVMGFLLGACVHTNAAVMDASLRLAPVCPDGVALFMTADRVGKSYTDVAILNSKGNSSSTSEKGMYNSQRKKAAELGANGIIINGIDEPKPGTKILGAFLGTGSERKGSAMAVHIPADSQRVRLACSRP